MTYFRPPAWLVPALALLFLVSGFSALIYQVLWTRMLGLIFGVTVHAASAVLAAYMGGLAIGSLLAGRLADRVSNPLRAFGFVEVGIAGAALLSPLGFEAVEQVYLAAHPHFENRAGLITTLRVLLAASLLLLPTALMGATLPLVLRSSLVHDSQVGARTAVLYATNTTGAIIGTLAAGFVLLPQFGIRASFLVAATGNLLVGAAAIGLSRLLHPAVTPPARASEPGTLPSPSDHGVAVNDTVRRAALGVAAISGFVGLALEIVWFRVLVLFLGPHSYAFTSMLAAVLLGIALGSFLVAPWLRRNIDLVRTLAALQMALSAAALFSMWCLAYGHAMGESLGQMTSRPFADYFIVLATVSLVSMVPAALLSGASFPVALSLWTLASRDHAVGRRVGAFYAVNVCGAILGSLAGGYVLLPLLGARGSLILLALLPLPLALVLLSTMADRRRALVTAGAGALAVGIGLIVTPDPFQVALKRLYKGDRILFHEEGVQTTVSIHERGAHSRPQRIMYLDGRHQANDTPDTLFGHRRIGLMPVVFHDNPKHALVIGLGGGATPGAVALYPGLRVTVVELSGTVVNGARWFSEANFDLLRRPSGDVRVGDGRNHLLLTRDRYDVITADIILPQHAGATNLYSQEYFRLVRNALSPRGLFAQWIGSSSDAEYKLIARTFLSVFPNATLWGGAACSSADAGRCRSMWPASNAAWLIPPFVRSSASSTSARRRMPSASSMPDPRNCGRSSVRAPS